MDKVIWKVEIEGRVCNKITYAVQVIVMDDFKGDVDGSWRVKFVVGVGDDHLYQMYNKIY